MKIKAISLHPYEIPLTNGQIRRGTLINIEDHEGNSGWGEVAPLPKWSNETLEDSLQQLRQKQQEIIKVDWTARNCLQELGKLNLLPSLSFYLHYPLAWNQRFYQFLALFPITLFQLALYSWVLHKKLYSKQSLEIEKDILLLSSK